MTPTQRKLWRSLGALLLAYQVGWVEVELGLGRLEAQVGQFKFRDDVMIRGKGVEIRRNQFEKTVLLARASSGIRDPILQGGKRDRLEKKILDRLVTNQILMARASDGDQAKAKAVTDEFMGKLQSITLSKKAFDRQLQAYGLSREEFVDHIYQRAVTDEVIRREIGAVVVIPYGDLEKFYREHRGEYEISQRGRVRHLWLRTEKANGVPLSSQEVEAKLKLALSVGEKIKKGEDFEGLIAQFSEDLDSRARGGEYVLPHPLLGEKVQAAAFALKVGEVSPMIVSPQGYHFVKLLETTSGKVLSFDEVKGDIREVLTNQEIQRRLLDYVESLKREANLQILDPDFQ